MSNMRINTASAVKQQMFDFGTPEGRLAWLLRLLCVDPAHYATSTVCRVSIDAKRDIIEDFLCDAQLMSYDAHLASLKEARMKAFVQGALYAERTATDPDGEFAAEAKARYDHD